jgi:hypothetical protein
MPPAIRPKAAMMRRAPGIRVVGRGIEYENGRLPHLLLTLQGRVRAIADERAAFFSLPPLAGRVGEGGQQNECRRC